MESAPAASLRELHLFILAGQSNMAGRGPLPDGPETGPDAGIQVLTEGLTWRIARDPLHFDKPEIAGVGPGLPFAREVRRQHPDWKIGLVPTAFGGSPLDDWQPGALHFENALIRARAAASAGLFAGILWHQGENDSRYPEKAATYGDRLARTIRAFRDELACPDLPFIAGGIAAFLIEKTDPGFPGLESVNRAIRDLPSQVSRTASVSADGLTHLGDQVHLDTPSQQEFGRRYAKAYLNLAMP